MVMIQWAVLLATCFSAVGTLLFLLLRYRRTGPHSLAALDKGLEHLEHTMERMERLLREESARSRDEFARALLEGRGEQAVTLKHTADSLFQQLASMSATLDKKQELIRTTVEDRLGMIQRDNADKLERMRLVVDEKLHGALEKRLGESFRQVSERLEQVYSGLGEMKTLAAGVGDLKRAITQVKTRGIWGEAQLGAMLEQIFTPEQYASNVATKGGSERVEFAIRLPGRAPGDDEHVWLPIDSKFPLEDYQRLLDAQEAADPARVEAAGKQLTACVRQCAATIREKYIAPPHTTPFAILFLPTEGLFAEVIRRIGVLDDTQKQWQVVMAGPTTLYAMLTSLQMGFRSLAIEKRTGEVWRLLGEVKGEWERYGVILEKLKKKLTEASNTVDDAQRRTRAIGRRLRAVEEIPGETEETGASGEGPD